MTGCNVVLETSTQRKINDTVSIIIVSYNSSSFIEACIKSILDHSNGSDYLLDIIMVDNNSMDHTVQIVKENYPMVRIIENEINSGYGSANNLGVNYAIGKYLIIINPDTVVEHGWLESLIGPLSTIPKIITSPKILIYDGSAISTSGNRIHYTGLAFAGEFGKMPDTSIIAKYISGISGCCFAIRKDDFIKLGRFDESIFMYHDDVDLSWRAHLMGFKILYNPSSIVKHNYSLKISPEKLYNLEFGRYIVLRKYLSRWDFLLISPSLVMAEILTFGYASKLGIRGVKYKLNAMMDGLIKPVIKVNGDKNTLFNSLDIAVPVDQFTYNNVEKMALQIFNELFKLNYSLLAYLYKL